MNEVDPNQMTTGVDPAGPAREWAFPLSFSQQRLWLLDQLDPGSVSFIIPWSLRLTGNLDTETLQKSLNEIIRRHEALRSTFRAVKGEPVQVVTEFVTISIPVTDLLGEPGGGREAIAKRIAKEEANTPLNLEQGPLLRAKLLRLDQSEHILLLTLHHIVFDGWSRRVFARELTTLYQAFCSSQPSPLPELSLQYPDYVVWQRKHLKGKVLEKQLGYWKEQLSGAPTALNFPTDRPRPARQTFGGASHSVSLKPETRDRVALFARQQGASLFMVLLAAFQALLARYSGEHDILLGTPIANRTRAKTEEMIGLFANTLVLRGDLKGDPTFLEIVQRAKQTALDAYAHQDVPFEKIVEEINPERTLSHHPLFQMMFSLQNAPRQAFELPGLQVKLLEGDMETSKLDLSIFLSEITDGISGRLEYDTDLFDGATIEALWRHYSLLLEEGVANPERRLSSLPLLGKDERDQFLHSWNQTEAPYRGGCLHEWFEEQAEQTPEGIACLTEGTQLTYRQLNERANQLARYLRRLGAGPGNRVGIFVERSAEMFVGLLGIQKSGAAYVPVDPAYPAERIRQLLEQAQVLALVTERHLEGRLPEGGSESVHRIGLEAEAGLIAQEARGNLEQLAQADDAVYVIFTSGSTGKPKGVEVSHRAVVNLLTSMGRELGVGSADVFPALASFAFDMSIPELYLALVTGGTVALAKAGLAGDGAALAVFLRNVGATIVHATPTTWRLLLDAGFTGKGLKRAVGAEALPPELCQRLLEADPSLYHFYGPTETTVWSTMHHFQNSTGDVLIGKPLANTRVYILDERFEPVPVGVEGELYIGGVGVANCYLNQPLLTDERFLPDPFHRRERMYRTGDRARCRAGGMIEYRGRADFQVKLRGYRIELGEIEAVLARHPAVAQSVAAVREDTPGDQRLIGYVTVQPDTAFDEMELRGWVKEHLPEYMVPTRVVNLERFALTPNGKVDRKRLPAVESRRSGVTQPLQAPKTPVEDVICQIWADVLKLDRVDAEDDFFHLGGHSLLGAQVVSRVREALSVELPLRALFEAPRVRELAKRVEALRHVRLRPSLESRSRPQKLPLSLAQYRLWFLEQLQPDNALYNVPYVVRLAGPLDLEIVEASLSEVVRRHEALRTRFVQKEGQPEQVIDPPQPVKLTIHLLDNCPKEERLNEARWQVGAEIDKPFDLTRAPLLRASVWKLDSEDHVLVLSMHHIVSDRWSLSLLAGELSTLYRAHQNKTPVALLDLPIQFADYALWQQQHLDDKWLEPQIAFWKQHLADAPPLIELPTDRPQSRAETSTGARLSTHLSAELTDGLKKLSAKEGASLFMTILAALYVMLAQYSGQDDIVVGTPIAGRNHVYLERLIGFFVNTLPLRSTVPSNASFREFLASVRNTVIEAHANQDVPFDKLVERLNPKRISGRNPLFQVMLVVQHTPEQPGSLGNAKVLPFPVQSRRSKVDLTLIVVESREGLRFTFEYRTDLFDNSTIERMQGHFTNLLEQVIRDPECRTGNLRLATQAEQQLVISEWNATEREHPRDACLQDLLRASSRSHLRKTAVVYGERRMSYEELDQRSNRLASYLRHKGVGPESLVGLLVSRSAEMVVAVLGILKAGGAYVPIDPGYPKDRIGLILEDTQMSFLITDRSLSELLPASPLTIIFLDDDSVEISRASAEELPRTISPANLAYMIFTSGSTGRPKGVEVTHANLVNFLVSMAHKPSLQATDKLLAVTSLSFDIAALELYLPLIVGATVLIASRDQTLDGKLLADMMRRLEPTTLQATPATWSMLIESGWPGSPRLKALCGGEALTPELAAKILPRCQELWNMYGPTETTVWSSIYKVEGDVQESVPIGRPIDNTRLYILDKMQKPVAVGVVGELYIGGEGVARGYRGQLELTQERFLPDPFVSDGRMYRTGDLAKFLPDGNVVYLGRTDSQVKIRGHRIELGEIEATLAAHPAVQACAVLVLEDLPGDKRLAAYYVPRPTAVDANALKAHLRRSLPDYLVPRLFFPVVELPLTNSGKIDRKALLRQTPENSAPNHAVKPNDDCERLLLRLFKAVLGIRSCGVTDNFFELGGHSLLLVRLASQIEQEFGTVVPIAILFKSPTIEAIATFLRGGDSESTRFIVPLGHAASGTPLFLVHAVSGDLVGYRQLVRRLDPEQTVYGIQLPTEYRRAEWTSSVETMASRYVQELQKSDNKGPYILAGWSAGAPIALEMAQQLKRKGFDVPLLIAIDAAPPNTGGGTRPPNPLYYLRLAWNIRWFIENEIFADFSADKVIARLKRFSKRMVRRLSLKRGDRQGWSKYRVEGFLGQAEYSESAKQFIAAQHVTLQSYVPQPYDGRVLLYKAKVRYALHLHEPDRKWMKITDNLEVVHVSGAHGTLMLGSHVDGLAKHLNGRLAAIRRGAPTSDGVSTPEVLNIAQETHAASPH